MALCPLVNTVEHPMRHFSTVQGTAQESFCNGCRIWNRRPPGVPRLDPKRARRGACSPGGDLPSWCAGGTLTLVCNTGKWAHTSWDRVVLALMCTLVAHLRRANQLPDTSGDLSHLSLESNKQRHVTKPRLAHDFFSALLAGLYSCCALTRHPESGPQINWQARVRCPADTGPIWGKNRLCWAQMPSTLSTHRKRLSRADTGR